MRRSISLLASLALLLTACSVGGNNAEKDDAKLEYTPQINEVEVMTLTRCDFPLQIISNGKLSAVRRSELSFRNGGVLTAINVSNGSYIQKNAVIASVDNSEQALALESAEIALKKAEFDLMDVLVGQGFTSGDTASVPKNILAMAEMRSGWSAAKLSKKQAQNALNATVIKAPFSGKIADLEHKVWDKTGAERFCTLIDDSSFDVKFNILESEYQAVKNGQTVKVIPFGGNTQITGTVVAVNPSIDKNGQVSVTARVPGASGLVDGMNVKVSVENILHSQLVVPKSAVVIRDNLDVLFRYADGKAEWVYVNILKSNGDSHVVEANADRGAKLSEGEQVIISGNFNLADESKVKLRNAE